MCSYLSSRSVPLFLGDVTARLRDLPASILTQSLGTFVVWIVAEEVGLSAILAVVLYAMTIARQRRRLLRLRREETIGDDALQVLAEEIDLVELSTDPKLRPIAA